MKRKSQSPQQKTTYRGSNRREFLGWTGRVATATALAGVAIPHVHAAEDNTIRLALIGCGGRGTGAAGDALSVPDRGPVKLYAMADVIEARMANSHKQIQKLFGDKVDVAPERQFVGFDAYKKAIDILKPGDVAMLTGYAGFRPVQLEYAVKKGINVFMEKTFAADPPGARRVIAAGAEGAKKNVKIAAGFMCRHSANRHELIKRIRNGELGDLNLIRANRLTNVGPLGKKPAEESELIWQFRNFFRFFWVSGGLFAEMTSHQIDEVCWLKDQLPVSAHGIGGRNPGSQDRAQNLDSYSVEFTFADGGKAFVGARYLSNCHNEFATYVHGTKKAAQFSGNIHASTVRTFKDQRIGRDNVDWKAPKEECSLYQAEWRDLIDAIRSDSPYNEAKRAAESNMAAMMARAAVNSGNVVTMEQIKNSNFQFFPGTDTMDYNTKPPLTPDAEGFYPVPVAGMWKEV